MPGGGQESEELLSEAVAREVAEEMGIIIEVKDLVFVVEGIHGEKFHRIDLVFLCEYIKEIENAELHCDPIGQVLGDPTDFRDYIMFTNGSVSNEIVVLSKQQGKIIMDEDMKYNTGARLYFDMKKIAENGLLIHDGIHMKVKNTLPLEPYLIWYATWDNTPSYNNVFTLQVLAGTSIG